jgi:hypothetical protein
MQASTRRFIVGALYLLRQDYGKKLDEYLASGSDNPVVIAYYSEQIERASEAIDEVRRLPVEDENGL